MKMPGDSREIEQVILEAFLTADHRSGTEQVIVNELRESGQMTLSLVAEDETGIIGYISISPVTVNHRACQWFGLGPVAVLPDRQGQGTGSRLVEAALLGLRQRDAMGCVVLGNPDFYGRFGFRVMRRLVLPGAPPEYFQALVLEGKIPEGQVAYASAFDTAASADAARAPRTSSA